MNDELPEYTPESAYGPLRRADGTTQLGRLSTTDEQYQDAVNWIVVQASKAGTPPTALIHWSRHPDSILTVELIEEHTPPQFPNVFYAGFVIETDFAGREIVLTAERRVARLLAEVTELAEKGQL